MGKFFFGVVSGILIVVLTVFVIAAVSLRGRSPAIANDSTLILRLSGSVPEKPPLDLSLPFLEQRTAVTVEDVWSLLRHAASDSRVRAVVFEPEDTSLGWAKMQEIHADLQQFRNSGKPLIAFLKTPGAREYYMATACAKIYMAPEDRLDLKGVAFETMYFRNTLDKLGVQVDVEHAGKYKDYGDMFTKTSMSPETREVMNNLADAIYGDLIAVVSKGRAKDAATMRAIVDDGPFLSTQALSRGLVDELRYEDQVYGELASSLHQRDLKKVSEHDFLSLPDPDAGKDKIAWVVGDGDITRGSADAADTSGIQSEAFDKILNRVSNDSSVKGVIVRIDSPGGEVTASDEIWRAMNDLSKKKPVVISMSDDAASGGYYMAMSGAPIIAYPATITGSIGVVFGKPNLHGLYDKIGITKDYVSRGRYARIESDYQSLTEGERQKLRDGIDAEYEAFVKKVADARHKPVSAIYPIAEGRVWLGDQAKANGLVDELGGIDRAVQLIKARAGIPASRQVRFARYPARRSLVSLVFRPESESGADAIVRRIQTQPGLESLRSAWNDAGLRVWMRGGMIRMMPFTIQFH